MMRKIVVSGVFVMALCFVVIVSAKPDFSGAWVMDRQRSFGIPANMQQSMTVKQTPTQLEVETKLIQPNNERTIKDTYVLDGKEYEFTPPTPPNTAPNTPAPQGKRTSNWLPNGEGITAAEAITTQTDKGPVTTQITKKWTFSGEGELTIAFFVDGPNGSYEAKRIFTRKP
jgi:hypothetical protein